MNKQIYKTNIPNPAGVRIEFSTTQSISQDPSFQERRTVGSRSAMKESTKLKN